MCSQLIYIIIYFFRRKAGHEYKNYLKHKSYQQNQLDR